MTIEMLNKGTILVSLGDEELRRYALCFDDSDAPKEGLKSLLYRVGMICGLDHRGKSYLIEALPSTEGCLLIISVREVKHRKIYRIKHRVTHEICVFFDVDAMLDFRPAENCIGGFSVYLYKERYVLLPDLSAPEDLMERLGEYGEIHAVSAAAAARVREHGRLLMQKELKRRHIGGRAVAVCNAAPRDGGG